MVCYHEEVPIQEVLKSLERILKLKEGKEEVEGEEEAT